MDTGADGANVEVKFAAEIRAFSLAEFRAALGDGRIDPDLFIRSALTGYRWRRAAETELYRELADAMGLRVVTRPPVSGPRLAWRVLGMSLALAALTVGGCYAWLHR